MSARTNKQFLLLSAVTVSLLFHQCSKEQIPSRIEPLQYTEWAPYIPDNDRMHLTSTGQLIVIGQPNSTIKRFDLNSNPMLDGTMYGLFHNQYVDANTFFHSVMDSAYLWVTLGDTLFVYNEQFNDAQQPLRKIKFPTTPGFGMRYFTIDFPYVYANAYNPANGLCLMRANISDLWNPTYANSVYYPTEVVFELNVAQTGDPKRVHNGHVFCVGAIGISIVNAQTLKPVNYINPGACKDFTIHDNKLYGLFSTHGGVNMVIYDISNPNNPRMLDGRRYNGNLMEFLPDRQLWLIQDQHKIRVFDVSNPEKIKLVNIYDINGLFYDNKVGGMRVRGDLLYMVAGVSVSKGLLVSRLPDL